MIALFALGIVLLAGTVWFLVRSPAPVGAQTAARRHPLLVVRDRLLAQLNELDAEIADGGIDAQIADDEKRRLEAELAQVLKELEAMAADPYAAAAAGRGRLGEALIVGVALTVIGVGVYLWNDGGALKVLLARPPATAGGSVPPMVYQMVGQLKARLAQNPNDAEGWALLARSYQVMGQAQDARQAYARAYNLAPGNEQILTGYAGLLYAEDPQHPRGEVLTLYRKLRDLDPDHPGALWVLGLAAFNDGQYREALTLWEHLKRVAPKVIPEDQRAQIMSVVNVAITQARARLH